MSREDRRPVTTGVCAFIEEMEGTRGAGILLLLPEAGLGSSRGWKGLEGVLASPRAVGTAEPRFIEGTPCECMRSSRAERRVTVRSGPSGVFYSAPACPGCLP